MTDTDLLYCRLLSDVSETDSEATITVQSYDQYEEVQDLGFQEGCDVLAHWSDGLFYLGIIVKVNSDFRKCLVKFEDKSFYWCSFHHLQKAAMPGADIVCSLCHQGRSLAPNEIVLCDNCNQGYHQKCHQPKISNKVLRPDAPWLCRKCVFATTARTGGAVKKGNAAQTLLAMKRSLPYNLKTLTWDLFHRTNEEECYCYCGGPGVWYKKMLKCARCYQWFHEACLQCLDYPLLNGDHLYIFVCCLCNSGTEFLHRPQLSWVEVAHLVVFNLSLQKKKKFFDLDSDILPFLNNNWTTLQLRGQIAKTPENFKRSELLDTFKKHPERFKSGSEIKKKMVKFSLRTRLPPNGLNFQVPSRGPLSHALLEKLALIHSSRDLNGSSKYSKKRFSKGKTSISEPSSSTSSSSSSQTNFYSSLKTKSIDQSDSEDASSIGTLDSIIPPPTNFEGVNHPFWNLDKPRGKKRKRQETSDRRDYASCMRHRKVVEAKRMNVGNRSSPDTGSESESLLQNRLVSPAASAMIPITDLKTSVSSFFGGANRIASGEKFNVLARRITSDGKVQHLIEWEGSQ